MSSHHKDIFKSLWNLRHLTINEALKKIATNPDLKFLLTTAGIWFVMRWLLLIWIGGHVIYFVGRIFNLVLI